MSREVVLVSKEITELEDGYSVTWDFGKDGGGAAESGAGPVWLPAEGVGRDEKKYSQRKLRIPQRRNGCNGINGHKFVCFVPPSDRNDPGGLGGEAEHQRGER